MNRKSALPMAAFAATGGLARTIDFYRARFRNFSSRCRCRSALLSLIRSNRSQGLGATKHEREGVARAKPRSDAARRRYGKQNDRPVRKQVTEKLSVPRSGKLFVIPSKVEESLTLPLLQLVRDVSAPLDMTK